MINTTCIYRYIHTHSVYGMLPVLETVEDGSHSLTRDEMSCVDESVFPQRFLDNACVGSIVDFFDYLDVEKKQEFQSCKFFRNQQMLRLTRRCLGYSQPCPRLTQEEFVLNLVNLCVLEMPVHAIQTLKLLHSVFDLCKKIEVSVEAHLLFSFLILADESTAQSSFVFGFMVFSDANNMQRSCRCLVVFRTFEKSRLKESDPPKKRGLTLYRSRCEWFTDFMYLTSHENPRSGMCCGRISKHLLVAQMSRM